MPFTVDIGNSRTKIALYEQGEVRLFQSVSSAIRACTDREVVHWGLGSVCPDRTEKVIEQIRQKRPGDTVTVLKQKEIPLKIEVDFPEKVGIDRLLAAYAAVCWKRKRPRDAQRPMLICDLGTAITVDLVSPEDVFLGGAILPGMNLAAKSLRRGTATLPGVGSFIELQFPGKNTVDAIQAGILGGTIGAIRRFYDLSVPMFPAKPLLLLTGGDAEAVFPEIRQEFSAFQAFYLPQLVLDGIYAVIAASRAYH